MNESESEHEEVNTSASSSQPLRRDIFPLRRKKTSSKKTDSGIVMDADNVDNDGASSDSDFEKDTSVKHNRRNRSATPYSQSSSDYWSGKQDLSEKASFSCHYINQTAFSTYMVEKIRQLPLPDTLKLYINYNREM